MPHDEIEPGLNHPLSLRRRLRHGGLFIARPPRRTSRCRWLLTAGRWTLWTTVGGGSGLGSHRCSRRHHNPPRAWSPLAYPSLPAPPASSAQPPILPAVRRHRHGWILPRCCQAADTVCRRRRRRHPCGQRRQRSPRRGRRLCRRRRRLRRLALRLA